LLLYSCVCFYYRQACAKRSHDGIVGAILPASDNWDSIFSFMRVSNALLKTSYGTALPKWTDRFLPILLSNPIIPQTVFTWTRHCFYSVVQKLVFAPQGWHIAPINMKFGTGSGPQDRLLGDLKFLIWSLLGDNQPSYNHFTVVGTFSHKFSIARRGKTNDQIKKARGGGSKMVRTFSIDCVVDICRLKYCLNIRQ